ncbi:TIGR02186 family protein [Limibacillus halophilus]|uniref:Uncharacterized protein (TIGR02186 family) n=1 Tax=Limibacillus halophilus TaxID=1579333 RepID=A0A839SW86_9PROT|nr:TIGR02186 family protein [Limibacillus halophilus]MBB3066558.1 uncharacterized protein (TIGR02186 family) [Limibacillus halophilus]
MRRQHFLTITAMLALLMIGPSASRSTAPLIVDLSSHLVAITTDFSGSDTLLFGAVEEEGDIIVVIKGPPNNVAVYRKSRVLGVWANTARQTFEGVPSFLHIASSAPIEEIAPPRLQVRHQLNLNALIRDLPTAKASPNIAAQWKTALIEAMQNEKLYPKTVGKVRFVGGKLFRTNVSFPSTVPTGSYLIQIYLLRDGEMISALSTPLIVSRVGMEADIYFLAKQHSLFYGLGAILIALFAGWLAQVIFRRN